MKNLLVIVFCLLTTSSTLSQSQKPIAIPLNDLDVHPYHSDYPALFEKTMQFVERLSKEPITTKGAIVIYPNAEFKGECVDGILVHDRDAELFIRKIVKLNTEVTADRFAIVRGEMSNGGIVYFWLVPSGAELPKAPEHFHPRCCCPSILVAGRPSVGRHVKQIRFLAEVTPKPEVASITYKWTVSGGKITSGQGTSEIVVDLGNAEPRDITATVNVGMNPWCDCETADSFTTQIKSR